VRLFSQKEKAFYLFKDDIIENGVVCHKFTFTPGSLVSNIFSTYEAIDYLAKSDSSIKFLDLEGTTYCFVKTRNKTYADVYYGYNFASIVGSMVDPGWVGTASMTPWIDKFAENQGEIFFIFDSGIMMIEMWMNDKKGAFKFTTLIQFIENVEKFVEAIK